MRVTRLGFALGSAVISCHLLAATADAQDRKAPSIHLSTALGSSVVSNYIEPLISLSEDAYVFVISVDADRNVQVLHPAGPGISVRMAAQKQLHLPRFFAGFGANQNRAYASYDAYGSGFSDSRGTIIALASRRPFNLAALSGHIDWDLDVLERLIEGRDPHSAASILARVIGARGEPIGRDILRYAGARQYYNTAYYNQSYYECSSYYGRLGYARSFSPGYSISFFRAAQLQQAGYVVRFLGTDACGQPQFVVYPNAFATTPLPGQQPATGAFPQRRLPITVPRNPTRDEVIAGRALDSRPNTGVRTEGSARSAPPAGRIIEPRSVPERFNPQPASPPPERIRVAAPERVSPPVRIPERMSPPPPPPPRPAPAVERSHPAPVSEPKPVDG